MTGLIIGNLPDTVHKSAHYLMERDMHVDCRGQLCIAENAQFGYGVKIITASHSYVNRRDFTVKIVRMPTRIDAGVFVGAFAILYNTHIGEGAVVAASTVILGRNVAPYVMVAGNPAQVIARWIGDHWEYDRKHFGKLE
jgi:acetyltransferase-like isoleucine patch superfamily enzyme